MNRALRIGLFTFPKLAHGGGFEEYLIRLANSLAARGHEVSVVTASAHEYRALNIVLNVYYRNPLLHDQTRVPTEEIRARLGKAELSEVATWRIGDRLRRCDIVYAKNELLDLTVLRVLRTARLPPIVCGVHTPMWFARATTPQARLHNRLYLGRTYRMLLSGVAAVHVSNSHDASLFPHVHGWPPDRLAWIPYPFVVDAAKPPPRREREGPLRVVWAARMTAQKGVDTLARIIDAVNRSSAAGDYEFVVAGSGDPGLEDEIRSAAGRYENVTYLGHVPRGEMRELYDRADVALVTSNWETFPYSCLEPQARGALVAAPDIPGCADIVEHDATGFLYPAGNVDAAVAALARVSELRRMSPGVLEELRRRALQRSRERYDPTALNDALERMLVSVAHGRPVGDVRGC